MVRKFKVYHMHTILYMQVNLEIHVQNETKKKRVDDLFLCFMHLFQDLLSLYGASGN